MNTGPSETTKELLKHRRYVNAVAQRLVANDHEAEDLSQQVFLYALEHPPRTTDSARGLRAWLRRVVRSFAINRGVSDRRRREREQSVGRHEAVDAPDEFEDAERLTGIRRAVAGLPEPYRTVVSLYYLDEVGMVDIALRMNSTVATVRTQLRRGRERLIPKLRNELPGELGFGGLAWFAWLWGRKGPALRPVSGAPAGARYLTGGAKAWSLGLALSALLCVTVLGLLHRLDPSAHGRQGTAAAPRIEPGPQPAPAAPLPVGRRVASRTAFPDRARGATALPAVERPRAVTVMDFTGDPVPGVGLRFLAEPDDRIGRPAEGPAFDSTDEHGRAEIPFDLGPGLLGCADPDWIALREGVLDPVTSKAALVVIAPAVWVTGEIVDAAHRPVPNATVVAKYFQNLELGALEAAASIKASFPKTRTDESGRFALRVARTDELALWVRHKDHPPQVKSAFFSGERVVLAESESTPQAVTGVVLDRADRPVAGALVAFGSRHFETDEQGRFEAPWRASNIKRALGRDPQLLSRLFALHPGSGMGEGTVAAGGELSVVRIDRETRVLEGVVLDESGQPVGGAEVWLEDPSYFPRSGLPSAEDLLGWMARERSKEGVAGPNEPQLRFRPGVSDSFGRFQLVGLADRAYTLRARLEDFGAAGRVGTGRVGTGRVGTGRVAIGRVTVGAGEPPAALQLRALEWGRSSVRIEDERGEPLVNLEVQLADVSWRVEDGRSGYLREAEVLASARSDEAGLASFAAAPGFEATLRVLSGGLVLHEERFDPRSDAGRAVRVRRASSLTLQNQSEFPRRVRCFARGSDRPLGLAAQDLIVDVPNEPRATLVLDPGQRLEVRVAGEVEYLLTEEVRGQGRDATLRIEVETPDASEGTSEADAGPAPVVWLP